MDRQKYTNNKTPAAFNYDWSKTSSNESKEQYNRTKTKQNNSIINGNVKLVPVKVKDFVKILQNGSVYDGKIRVLIESTSSKEDILNNLPNGMPTKSPNDHLENRDVAEDIMSNSLGQTPRGNGQKKHHRETDNVSRSVHDQQIFAMPDVQAFPMIGTRGFRAEAGRLPRDHYSRRKKHKSPGSSRSFRIFKSRPKTRSRSRTNFKPHSQSKTRRNKIRHRKHSLESQIGTRKVKIPVQQFCRLCCSPEPLYDNECRRKIPDTCKIRYQYIEKEPENTYLNKHTLLLNNYEEEETQNNNPCQHLKFISPGVCHKKKVWTNEYAILPKGQVNLIDPCADLDLFMLQRPRNPCIRDSRGNPLTDCIGRSLRDQTGRNLLRFNSNGSIIDPGLRTNFVAVQPPLCMKHQFPDSPCTAPNQCTCNDYPKLTDVTPFFKEVVDNDNLHWHSKYHRH